MNGAVNLENNSLIDRRPIITCAGELEVFLSIQDGLSQALPQDLCEWRRSLGRSVRMVHIGANFTPFNSTALPKTNQWDLIRQPLFHIYWTECNDVDVYKASIREDIENWLKELNNREIPDWLIVVVENYDGKRANKLLPRTTVLDKIRADFAPKQEIKVAILKAFLHYKEDRSDLSISLMRSMRSVINPGRVEAKSADSWRGLVGRIRHLMLISYARAVSKLEDHVRQQRERRNEPGWDFMEYFKLQEELAQVLEMLGLYDEALVQYDELDALFSQFVVNGQSGENVSWLSIFQRPLERWHALKLGPATLPEEASLLELRAYLYAKQAHMLLLTDKIWEVASRCLPFLHTCNRELVLLEITSPPGAVASWLFLACMEVLQSCNEHNKAEQVDAYFLHTASLWAYASQKLRDLGELCGLMPGSSPTSDQLHTVVYLSAGMGDNPGSPSSPSPTDKLKQAICSQAAFNRTYLELAELAVGTYKHIGRLRSARLVGREVASFYMLLGEVQKSAVFLGDALKTFEQDNWRELAAQTHIELAECYKLSGDIRKYIRSCAAVAAAPEIDNLIRWGYFDEMRRSLSMLDRTLIVPFKDIIRIVKARIINEAVIMQDCPVEVELEIDSNFPGEMICDRVMISIETDVKDAKKSGRRSSNVLSGKDLQKVDISLQRLRMQKHLDYKQDKQLASASVVCRNVPLKRADSTAAPLYHSEFNDYIDTTKVPQVITPGNNVIRLTKRTNEVGKFYLGQVALHCKLMELISVSMTPRLFFEVKREEPTVRLDKGEDELLSGIEQIMKLTIIVGSYPIEKNSCLKLTASRELLLQYKSDAPLENQMEVSLEQTNPFSSTCIPIRILAEIPAKDHQVTIACPWSSKTIPVTLTFSPPLTISWRLHTVKHRKYIQFTVTGQCEKSLFVSDANLSFGSLLNVKSFSKVSSQILHNGLNVSFNYELLLNSSGNSGKLKGDFSIKYAIDTECVGTNQLLRDYHYYFEIVDYQTLYYVEAKVEPTKGNEFCRVGSLCHLQLQIKLTGPTLENAIGSLMYEVVADQNVWAVCGRTAGVVSFETGADPQTVILDVMPLSSGYLPLPLIRLSKYIPADYGLNESHLSKSDQHPRLEAFSPGQIYNASKGQQVYVISSSTDGHVSVN